MSRLMFHRGWLWTVPALVLLGGMTAAGMDYYPPLSGDGRERQEDGARQIAPRLARIVPDVGALARDAVSVEAAVAQPAIEALRAMGPGGLDAQLVEHADLLRQQAEKVKEPASVFFGGQVKQDDPAWQRLAAALDAVAGQRDCHAARLFWYTDFNAAQAAAKASGKPILSLRLLGKLTDEFSCANSRFFRSTLYANEEVGKALRERFVLHWQSVRPVPRVTIDFGDGRKLQRTLTGNSIHYVLDADGRVIDALPGLYGPKAFLRGISDAESLAKEVAELESARRRATLREFHERKNAEITVQWRRDLLQLGLMTSEFSDVSALSQATDERVWAQIAKLHAADAQLDAATIALIRSQNPSAAQAGALAVTKREVEDPLLRLVRNFQNTIAIDTVRNEYTLHRQIHDWFASGEVPLDVPVDDLNRRVYAELFLTPDSDPWLGLLPDATYTALDDGGVLKE
jgi:hypothetical protein